MQYISGEQAILPDQETSNLSADLKRFYKTCSRDAEANDWRYLKTVAGSKDQPVRRDFPPSSDTSKLTNPCSVPGSIVIVLQDNTSISGFGWNAQIAMRSEREAIRLNKGDILMFRGDFIYPAVGYSRPNVCLHAYLGVPGYERDEFHQPQLVPYINNDVYICKQDDDRFCFAWRCEYVRTGAHCVRKHLNQFHGFCLQESQRTYAPGV
ncbi:hypothetical protein JG688_00004117 [Phytophthora aleatoria]|uniref:Uncharacterized protein n=1 Tax=Phytophthora aleatoria TaxID=2496075 RepID=A0A8J5JEA1_9STRA|nr:hypothetical protein JG688_00004117 [Phytophthora aleatoria]